MNNDPLTEEVIAELEAEHRAEMRQLSYYAFVFLLASSGDKEKAKNLVEDFLYLLFEDGVLSTWRYRLLLSYIDRGL